MEAELADCAAADTAGLKFIFRRHKGDDQFLRRLLDCCEDLQLEQQASWLLKRFLESGGAATHDDAEKILRRLESVSSWQSQLHFLQSFRHLNIPQAASHRCLQTLRRLACHRRNFVRAWAYDALAALAEQHQDCRDAAMELIHSAHADEAPSVQARLRNILKSH